MRLLSSLRYTLQAELGLGLCGSLGSERPTVHTEGDGDLVVRALGREVATSALRQVGEFLDELRVLAQHVDPREVRLSRSDDARTSRRAFGKIGFDLVVFSLARDFLRAGSDGVGDSLRVGKSDFLVNDETFDILLRGLVADRAFIDLASFDVDLGFVNQDGLERAPCGGVCVEGTNMIIRDGQDHGVVACQLVELCDCFDFWCCEEQSKGYLRTFLFHINCCLRFSALCPVALTVRYDM